MGVYEEMLETLIRLEMKDETDCLAGLADRKKRELEFHDRDRDRERMTLIDKETYKKEYGNIKFYGGARRSALYVDTWLKKNVPGKIFLDYACGNGGQAIKVAEMGAKLSLGIDLSRISIENARKDARLAKVDKIAHFIQGDVENTLLPAESIDVILCSGMLHHLDLSYAFPEIRRILAPGGRVLAVEALAYNPFIKLYRKLTPGMRTIWEREHILSLEDVKFASRFFRIGEIRYWHIATVLYPYSKALLPLLETLDAVLTRLPGIRKMAWQFTFEMNKKEDE